MILFKPFLNVFPVSSNLFLGFSINGVETSERNQRQCLDFSGAVLLHDDDHEASLIFAAFLDYQSATQGHNHAFVLAYVELTL